MKIARLTIAKMYKRGWKSSKIERALKGKKNGFDEKNLKEN